MKPTDPIEGVLIAQVVVANEAALFCSSLTNPHAR